MTTLHSTALSVTKPADIGSVAWSIHADSPRVESAAVSLNAATRLDQNLIVERLLTLCDQYKIAGTWFFSQPSGEPAIGSIVARSTGHAIGMTIDAGSIGGRSEFARKLRREQALLERRNIDLRSLQVDSTAAGEHYDLLIKQGISIVDCLPTGATRAAEPSLGSLRQLRHGLWTLPTALPATARGMTGSLCAWWRATSTVLAAADGRKNCHLSIDLAQLSLRGMQWTLLAKVMRVQAGLRREGRLQIATAETFAAQATRVRQPLIAARSILRAA